MLKTLWLLQDGAPLWCIGFQKAQAPAAMLTILGGWILISLLWSITKFAERHLDQDAIC